MRCGAVRCGAVRCGAVRCGRLVQGGHGAGAARVRFFLMRLRAAAIGAVVITVGMLGFSLGMFVLSSVRLLSSALRMEMLTTLWPDALDCIVTRGGRSTRARRAPARAARRGRAAGHAASISARGMVFLSRFRRASNSETQLLRVGSGSPRRTRLSGPCPASPPWSTWWVTFAPAALSLMPTR